MQYSFSKLTQFYDCPYAFYRYYFKKEKGDNNVFAEYGILVHSILERYAKGELEKESLVEEFKSGFELFIQEPILMFGRDLTQTYFDKGVGFFSNFKGFWELEPLQSEFEFETSLGNDTFVGVIDLICRDSEGNIIIIDHNQVLNLQKRLSKPRLDNYICILKLFMISMASFQPKYGLIILKMITRRKYFSKRMTMMRL